MQKKPKPEGFAFGRRTVLQFPAVLTELETEHQFGLCFNALTPKCGSNFPHVCRRFPVYLPNAGPNICAPKPHLLYEPMCCENIQFNEDKGQKKHPFPLSWELFK